MRQNKIVLYVTRCGLNWFHILDRVIVLAFCCCYKIPFYILAYGGPDRRTPKGEGIPIEERDEREVLEFMGTPISGPDVRGYYPAFDLTPPELVTAIITSKGVEHLNKL